MPNRVYDPSVGVWLGRDPIELASGQVNPDDYCNDDPENRTDPSGLLGEEGPLVRSRPNHVYNIKDRNDRNILQEAAKLARGAYSPTQNVGDWKYKENWSPDKETPGFKPPPPGFGATLYENGGYYVLSFRGTDDNEIFGPDGKADLKQEIGLYDKQYDYAVYLARSLRTCIVIS